MKLSDCKRIVFKVGTSTLTYSNYNTNIRRLQKLVWVLADLHNSGKEVALVTSGAIAVGVGKLRLSQRPEAIPSRQAASCVGQCELMFLYNKFFSEFGLNIGEMLITNRDIEDAESRRNLHNTFESIFALGAIPVINENDSVSVDEIVFGDNDHLSAAVAKLVGADALVMLTDTDGLFDANPVEDPNARLIPKVDVITDEMLAAASGTGSSRGTGGMVTKLDAAKLATEAGIETFVINGSDPADIYKLVDGRSLGTHFKALSADE